MRLLCSFASLPQKDAAGRRTKEEAAAFSLGLEVMGACYASITGTCVLLQKAIPSRPAQYDGWVTLFNVPDRTDKALLRSMFGDDGERLETVELDSERREARLRFATHELAEVAVSRQLFRERPLFRQAACDFLFNATPYESSAEHQGRGWTSFEQGVAKLAAAHIEHVSRNGDGSLPKRLAGAARARPKLFDISHGQVLPCAVTESPRAILKQTTAAVATARFVGKGDQVLVQNLLAALDWTMQLAMEKALALEAGSEVEPDPSLLHTEGLTWRERIGFMAMAGWAPDCLRCSWCEREDGSPASPHSPSSKMLLERDVELSHVHVHVVSSRL